DMQTTIDLCDGCTNSSGNGAVVDTRNRRLNYGLSDSHTAHRFVLSGVVDLPFGAGRRMLATGPGAAIAGGWSLSGITTLASGIPFTLHLNFDKANTGHVNLPNPLPTGRLDPPAADRR